MVANLISRIKDTVNSTMVCSASMTSLISLVAIKAYKLINSIEATTTSRAYKVMNRILMESAGYRVIEYLIPLYNHHVTILMESSGKI